MRLDFLTHHDFMNRELSWMAFNERVLALSQDAGQPLLERANFLSIRRVILMNGTWSAWRI